MATCSRCEGPRPAGWEFCEKCLPAPPPVPAPVERGHRGGPINAERGAPMDIPLPAPAPAPVDVEAGRTLLARATPGPWAERFGDIVQLTDAGKGFPLDQYPDSKDIVLNGSNEYGDFLGVQSEADRALIVWARNNLDNLLGLAARSAPVDAEREVGIFAGKSEENRQMVRRFRSLRCDCATCPNCALLAQCREALRAAESGLHEAMLGLNSEKMEALRDQVRAALLAIKEGTA